jgi:hypothetical protein
MQFILPPVPLHTMGDFSNGGAKVLIRKQNTKKFCVFIQKTAYKKQNGLKNPIFVKFRLLLAYLIVIILNFVDVNMKRL